MLRRSPHTQTRGGCDPGDGAPPPSTFRPFFFSKVASREAQLEAKDRGVEFVIFL